MPDGSGRHAYPGGAREASCRCFQQIHADIGDEQKPGAIAEHFRSHISRISHILKNCNERTLVLHWMSFEAGTDPVEGGRGTQGRRSSTISTAWAAGRW